MDDNSYISEYLNAIQYILPGIDRKAAEQILSGEVKIDAYCDGLSQFNFHVANGITNKYIAFKMDNGNGTYVKSGSPDLL